MLALVQHHPAEGEIVVDRRDQPAGAGLEDGRAGEAAAAGLVEDREAPPVCGIGPVAGREAVELRLGHAEAGVLHAERREDALAQEVSSVWPEARAISTPRMSEPLWYSHFSPG